MTTFLQKLRRFARYLFGRSAHRGPPKDLAPPLPIAGSRAPSPPPSDGMQPMRSDGMQPMRSDGTQPMRSDGTQPMRSEGTRPTPFDGMPALAAVHASVASAIGDHVAFRGFVVRRVGQLVLVSVHVGFARRQFIVDSRETDSTQRLHAKLVRAFPRALSIPAPYRGGAT